jgi:hypothetical protein
MRTTSQLDIASHLYQVARRWKAPRLIAAHYRLAAILTLMAFLLCGSILPILQQSDVYALSNSSGGCIWYKVRHGDTLGSIARRYNTDIQTLAQTNHISNANLIFSGESLCIQRKGAEIGATSQVSIQASQAKIAVLLRKAAASYNIPANLVMAIAWQESGWRQSAISPAGAIGIMQVMPGTAASLNATAHTHYNPHQLQGNIQLGAFYLHNLWNMFRGNLDDVISAYNEGPGNVIRQGISNWGYVNSVLALMKRF